VGTVRGHRPAVDEKAATTVPSLCAVSRAVSVAVLVAMAAGACSDGAPEPAPSPSPTVTASPSPPPSPSPEPPTPAGEPRPLNGLPVEDDAALDRRVVAVKIDDHPLARPQAGLDRADAVMELLVEGGLTRFIALFHAEDAAVVGPMRSGRPTDPGLVGPLGATFAISGAQPWVIDQIRAADVALIGDVGPPTTFRSPQRRAPHNLFTDTTRLRDLADQRGFSDAPPPTWFRFGAWEETVGEAAGDLVLQWSSSTTIIWSWDGTTYTRLRAGAPHTMVTGDDEVVPVVADTHVVLTARRYTARPPGRGSAVPALDTVGAGRAVVAHGGRVVEGTWSRDTVTEPFALTDPDGAPLAVPPGRLWVSIFPDGGTLSW
jgi:hypothetical protein